MKHYFNKDKSQVLVELDADDIMYLKHFINSAKLRYNEYKGEFKISRKKADDYWSKFYEIGEEMKNNE